MCEREPRGVGAKYMHVHLPGDARRLGHGSYELCHALHCSSAHTHAPPIQPKMICEVQII